MPNLNFTYDTLGNWFFTFYESLEASPAPRGTRRSYALGVIVNAWTYCVERSDPGHCATRSFADALLGVGAFDSLVENGLIVDGDEPRWTGHRLNREWLTAAGADDGKSRHAMLTYVIRAGDDGHIKIGRTRSLRSRMEALQTGAARKLVLLRKIAGDHEKRLHAACAEFRCEGEWFDASPAFLEVLERELASIAKGTR